MSATTPAPSAQQERFAAYLNRLAQAAHHADRAAPLGLYCTGLVLPGECSILEPAGERLGEFLRAR